MIAPGYGYHYVGADPYIHSNAIVEMVEYHIDTLPIFQDILDTIALKGGWLIVRTDKGEHPVICMVQDEAI